MPDSSSTGPEKTSLPKKPISPARNMIGLIVLVVVVVIGYFEYSAYFGHKWAVAALNARALDEAKELMTIKEAETLLNKEADGPAEDFRDDVWSFDKKTYTWKGLLKQHTVTAYYTKEQDSRMHHFESEGSKYDLKANRPPPTVAPTGEGATVAKGQGGRGGGGGGGRGGGMPKSKTGSNSKGKNSAPGDKATTTKPEPSDKTGTTKPEPTEKAGTTKPEPSDKAGTSKPEPSDKAGTPKTEPAGDAPPKAKPSEPGGKAETPK
jgi:hypothetical protein